MPITVTKTEHPLPTRATACQKVISGLQSIDAGLLDYDSLGLTVSDLYGDLEKAGWKKSKRTLQRAATQLRAEGLLPESPGAAATKARERNKHGAKSGTEPVEKPQPKEEKKDVSFQPINSLDDLFTTTPENNGRQQPELQQHHQPGRLIQSNSGGDIQRSDWFIPDHIQDSEAHAAYQQILGLLTDAAELCREWQPLRRIDNLLWDEIAGHSQTVTAFANTRFTDIADAEPSASDADGCTVDVTATREPSSSEGD